MCDVRVRVNGEKKDRRKVSELYIRNIFMTIYMFVGECVCVCVCVCVYECMCV